MKQKKILIITPGFLPLLGGMEEQVYTLSREFISQGVKVDVLTERTEKSFEKTEVIDGISVTRIEKPNRRSAFFLVSIYRQIRSFLRINTDYDLIIIRTFTSYGLCVGLMKLLKIVKISTFITADTGGENDELTPIVKSKIRPLYRLLFGKHDYINSICQLNYEKYLEIGFPKRKLTKIYNGLDCRDYSKSKYPKRVQNFLFIAQLKKEKGIYETLKAFKVLTGSHSKSKLFVAGDGPEYDKINNWIAENKLRKNIILLGRVSRDKKKEFFGMGECLVLPSYSEGFGLVYYEAAIYKRAIIATDVADVKEIFQNQVLYAKKMDASDLHKKMLFAIENLDPSRLNYDEVVDLVDVKKTTTDLLHLK